MSEYEIRIRGRVTPALLARFEGMTSHEEPVETVLHGPIKDQAELHGTLALVRSLGLELVEVRKRPATTPGTRRPRPGTRSRQPDDE
jgi:hypothetical protein